MLRPLPNAPLAMSTGIAPLPSVASRLADEYLVLIFEHLSTDDLHSVCLASKRFYGCGIRLLNRHLRYSSDNALLSNMAIFWDTGPGRVDAMKTAPTAVTMRGLFRDSEYVRETPWMIWSSSDAGGWGGHARWESRFFYQILEDSPLNACSRLFAHLLSLTALNTISFDSCVLPDKETLSLLLRGMPKLQTLSLRGCTFIILPLPESVHYGTSTSLPINSLVLVGNQFARRINDDSNGEVTFDISPFPFCLSPSLKTLELTWDDMTMNSYVMQSNFGTQPIGLSECLETLTIHVEQHRADMDGTHLVRFLHHECAHVRRAAIHNWHGEFPPDLKGAQVLPKLESYTGSGSLAPYLVHDTCKEVHLVGPEQAIASTTSVLSRINPNITVLSFIVSYWDMEVLYAVTQMFRDLQILKIMCRQGRPNADTFLVMPWRFFNSYTALKVLHIYEVGIPVCPRGDARFERRIYASISRDRVSPARSNDKFTPNAQTMCGLWNKACPSLVEVKWTAEERMVKSGWDWIVLREPSEGAPPAKASPRRTTTVFEHPLPHALTDMMAFIDDEDGEDEWTGMEDMMDL